MRIVPVSFKDANEFVKRIHRHHKPVVGMKFAVGLETAGVLVGVVIVGRPIARRIEQKYTVEVTRCCTDGSRNACSMLYRSAWRAAKALGYTRMITYTLPEEGGVSLRASGFVFIGAKGGGNWNVRSRPRADTPAGVSGLKHLWEITCQPD